MHFPRIGRSDGADGHCAFSSIYLCYIHSALFLALKLVQVEVLNVCQTLVCVKFRISHKYGILVLPKFKVCNHMCTWSTTRWLTDRSEVETSIILYRPYLA